MDFQSIVVELLLSVFDFFGFNVYKFLLASIKDYFIVAYFCSAQIIYVSLSVFNLFSSLPNALISRRRKGHDFCAFCKNRDAFDCPLDELVKPLCVIITIRLNM